MVKYIPRLMLFFPSVTFGAVQSEIFPWGIIYSLTKIVSIQYRFIPLMLWLVLSALYSLATAGFDFINELARSTAAYLNVLLVFSVLLSVSPLELNRIRNTANKVLLILFLWGRIQFSGLLSNLNQAFNFIVPRGALESIGFSRGVTLFSSEPSRGAVELIFLYASWRLYSRSRTSILLLFDIAVALFVIVFLKSAVGFVFVALYIFLVHKVLHVSILLAVIVWVTILSASDNRVYEIGFQLLGAINSPSEVLRLIIDASGFRVISVYSAYFFGGLHILGGGLGSWVWSSILAMEQVGISPSETMYFIDSSMGELTQIRPTAFMASIALELGLLGVCLCIYFLLPYIRKGMVNKISRPLTILFLFFIFIHGDIGNPVPWISFVLAVRYAEIYSDSIPGSMAKKIIKITDH